MLEEQLVAALVAVTIMFYGVHVLVYKHRGFAVATRRIGRVVAAVIDLLANTLHALAKWLR